MVRIGLGLSLTSLLGGEPGAGGLPSLSLSIDPASVSESDGTTTGTVTRPADQTTGILTVNLSSSDTSEATVPATVDIPDGQQSANFTITILNENLADGDQVVSISASATDYNGASAAVTVTDVGVSTFDGINSIAISDVNIGDGSNGVSGEPATFTDAGSLGGTWDSNFTNHRFNIGQQNGIYRATMDGRASDGDVTWARASSSTHWDGTPEVDVFLIAVAGQDGFSPSLMRFMGSPINFYLSSSATGTANPPGTTVNGADGVNAKDAHDQTTDFQAFLVRVPAQTISGSGPSIGTFLAGQYPRNGAIIRFCAIPSTDVAANLADILAELQTTVDTYNGV